MNREMIVNCRWVVSLLLMALSVSCSSVDIADVESGAEVGVEVILPVSGGASQGAATRTALSTNGTSATWVVGDQVALWADIESSGESYLVGETFQLKYFGSNYQTAEFAGTISQSMTEQEYSYSGFYPVPKSISGKSITFEIPSTQSGEYDGDLDFRVADPVVGRELTESTLGGCEALSFRSIMHALKITIPEGQNDLSDNPVKQIVVSMPEKVVGSFSFDMSQTDSDVVMSSGSSVVTLELSSESELSEGDGRYAWLFFNPTTLSAGSSITFAAVDTAGVMSGSYELLFEDDHTFAAAHITPINIYVPKESTITTLEVKIGTNNLNEKIDKIKFSAASDAKFEQSNTNEVEFEVDSESSDIFYISYDTSIYGDLFMSQGITVEFDSASAVTTDLISLADITVNKINSVEVTVPYLLFENFTKINTFEYYTELCSKSSTISSTGSSATIDLSSESYGLETSDWVASRVGGDNSNGSIRLSGFEYNGTKYAATLTSPTITGLKSGATITVSYNYSGSELEYYYDGIFSDGKTGDPIYSFYSNVGGTSTTLVSSDKQGTSGGYGTITSSYSTDITISDDSDDSTDLYFVWEATDNKGSMSSSIYWQNGNYYLYLDNIKVIIAD